MDDQFDEWQQAQIVEPSQKKQQNTISNNSIPQQTSQNSKKENKIQQNINIDNKVNNNIEDKNQTNAVKNTEINEHQQILKKQTEKEYNEIVQQISKKVQTKISDNETDLFHNNYATTLKTDNNISSQQQPNIKLDQVNNQQQFWNFGSNNNNVQPLKQNNTISNQNAYVDNHTHLTNQSNNLINDDDNQLFNMNINKNQSPHHSSNSIQHNNDKHQNKQQMETIKVEQRKQTKQQDQQQWQQGFVQATPINSIQPQTTHPYSSNNNIDNNIQTQQHNNAIQNKSTLDDQMQNDNFIQHQNHSNYIANQKYDHNNQNNNISNTSGVGNNDQVVSSHDNDQDQFGDYQETNSNATPTNITPANNNTLQHPTQHTISQPSLSAKTIQQKQPYIQKKKQSLMSAQSIQQQSSISKPQQSILNKSTPLTQSQVGIQQAKQSSTQVTSPSVPVIQQYQPYKRPQIKVEKKIYSEEDIAKCNQLIAKIPNYSFIRATCFIGQ